MELSKSLEQTKKGGLRVNSTKSEKPRRFAVLPRRWTRFANTASNRIVTGRCSAPTTRRTIWFSADRKAAITAQTRAGARVKELMKKAGLNGVSPHSLRHTHASELLSKGVPIPTVAKRLGHANANITLSIYAYTLEADELAAAKIWDDSMAEVIVEYTRQPARMLAVVSAEGAKKLQVEENTWEEMAGTTGLEPATSDVTGRRSNQLNYVPALRTHPM
jgi:hypothetical protein